MKKYEFEPLSIIANNLKLERYYETLLKEKQKLQKKSEIVDEKLDEK